MSPSKKLGLNVPPHVHAMIRSRMAQLPFRSESDYLLALTLHDCRFRRPQAHAFGERVLNQQANKRDEDLQQIVADFSAGIRPMDEGDLAAAVSAVFVDYFQTLPVRMETMKHAPVEPPRLKKLAANNRKPLKRKRARR